MLVQLYVLLFQWSNESWEELIRGINIMRGINFSDILFDEKLYENILIWHFIQNLYGCKPLCSKPLCIWFDKIDGLFKTYDGIRYLVLFGPKRYDAIYDRIRDLMKKVVLHIVFIILQKSEFIHIILYFRKNTDFSKCCNSH